MKKLLQIAPSAAGAAWCTVSHPLVMVLLLVGLAVWLYMTGQAFQWLARSDRHAPWVALTSVSGSKRANAHARTSRANSRARENWARRTQHA